MKKLNWSWIFIVVLMLDVVCVAINSFIFPLPDWIIRTLGIIALISVVGISYKTARMNIGQTK